MLVVISPPVQPGITEVLMLEDGTKRSVWRQVCLRAGPVEDFAFPNVSLYTGNDAWENEGRYIGHLSMKRLVTGTLLKTSSHEGMSFHEPHPFEQYLDEQPAMVADSSREVLGKIGSISCINVARVGEPVALRYFGRGKGCSGQAHETPEQAEADVKKWASGMAVAYVKHAEIMLAEMGLKLRPLRDPADEYPPRTSYVLGPDNTWPQAWEALLNGHQVRLPGWASAWSWIYERNHNQILLVVGETIEAWRAMNPRPNYQQVSAPQMQLETWIVVPKPQLIASQNVVSTSHSPLV